MGVVSHIQLIGHQPEKLPYRLANPASCGLLNRKNDERRRHAYPRTPLTKQNTNQLQLYSARVWRCWHGGNQEKLKINHKARTAKNETNRWRIHIPRLYAGLDLSRAFLDSFGSSTRKVHRRRLGGFTHPCTVTTTFPRDV